MPALANVALTDTFDTWRVRTNQIIVKGNDDEVITTAAFNKANTFNNVYTTIAGANTAVGAGANAYANLVWSSVNTSITGANAFTSATIAGANTAVGAGANAFTSATIAGANTISIAAFNKANTSLANTSGTVFAGNFIIKGNVTIGDSSVGIATNGLLVQNSPTQQYNRIASYTANTLLNVGFADVIALANNGTHYTQVVSVSGAYGGLYVLANTFGFVGTVNQIPMSFYTNSTERMLIDSSGNVGIGTAFPAATLDVSGSVTISKANVLSQTLTDAATINWNTASGQIATVTLGGNRTMAAPTNLKVGTLILHVIQDGTGGRTLTWDSVFKWPAGAAPVLTSTSNRRDLFSFVCDGTNLYGSFLPDVR